MSQINNNSDNDIDKLFEELQADRSLEESRGGNYGGYGGYAWRHDFASWYWHQYKTNTFDIVYRDSDRKYHREHGPAYVNPTYDVEEWYKHGVRHCETGPAITHKETKIWMRDGLLHNLNGPAIIDPGGPKQYWIDGQKLSPKQYKKEIARRKRSGNLERRNKNIPDKPLG